MQPKPSVKCRTWYNCEMHSGVHTDLAVGAPRKQGLMGIGQGGVRHQPSSEVRAGSKCKTCPACQQGLVAAERTNWDDLAWGANWAGHHNSLAMAYDIKQVHNSAKISHKTSNKEAVNASLAGTVCETCCSLLQFMPIQHAEHQDLTTQATSSALRADSWCCMCGKTLCSSLSSML